MQLNLLNHVNDNLDIEELTFSFKTEYGSLIRYYDDDDGPFWILCNSLGVSCIIRARDYDSAYDIYLDEFADRVSAEDLHEAYDCHSNEEMKAKIQALEDDGKEPYLDLIEGYHYMPNSSGTATGIISIDLNGERLETLTINILTQYKITMEIKL